MKTSLTHQIKGTYGCHPSRSLLLFVPKDLYIEFFCLSHALPPTLRSRWKGVEEVEVEEGSHQGLGSPEPGDGTFLIPGSGRQLLGDGDRADIVTEKYLGVLFCNPLIERRRSRTEGEAKVAARILVYKGKV